MIPRLLLDARKLGDTGIGVYIENLVYGLLELKDNKELELDITLLVGRDFFEQQASESLHEFRNKVSEQLEVVLEPAGKYSFSEYLLLAWRQRRVLARSDVFHSPHYTLPFLGPFWGPFLGPFRGGRSSAGERVATVVTIHDLIHVSHGEHLGHRLLAPLLIRSAVSRADKVIAVSNATRSSLVRLCRGEGGKISVVPNALQSGINRISRDEARTIVADRFPVLGNFVLFVGSERPHKGFDLLCRAWGRMLRSPEGINELPQIAVVGGRYGGRVRQMIYESGLAEHVCLLGEVKRSDLSMLYNAAEALIAPSREEGFGLPLIEAMACSLPIICTPLPSFREVCGDYPIFAAKVDAASLEEAVRRYLGSKELFTRAARSGPERINRCSRRDVARQTCEVYQHALRQIGKSCIFLGAREEQAELMSRG